MTAATPSLAFRELVAFTTSFSPAEVDRSHNIALAATKLDGVEIAPGATFSFNRTVGARNLDQGYRNAPTLTLDGREPALGGGVCQLSSTLYNALLLADVSVVQRHAHSRAVKYVAMGRDAAVAWGSKDLQLRNDHPFPLRLRALVENGRVTITVLGTDALPTEVRLVVGDREPASPRKELQMLEFPDDLAVGGYWVRLYRHRVKDGSIIGIEPIAKSTFYPYKRDVGP